jgi:hypothetical protein
MGALCLALLALAAASPSPPASPPAPASGPVTLFLMDNSASLPPLDPNEQRVAALERMFSFLQGQPYRLVLFGGKREVFVDDLTRYRNNGQWTDFYAAFSTARKLMATYPEGTEFRLVLLTDGMLDPNPADWADAPVPAGQDLKAYVAAQTLDLLHQMKTPLYVILVGELPKEGAAPGSLELAPRLILDMVQAANGRMASPFAQSLSSFVKDDGVLLKKFVFRVAPYEGLRKVQAVVRRIVAPSRPMVEVEVLTVLILPLTLFLFLLLGILVRSFPGPGDAEIVELAAGQPIQLAADRLHRVEGGWASLGLSLVASAKDAAATLVYEAPHWDASGGGLSHEGLDPVTERLLGLSLDELRGVLKQLAEEGTKEEKIYALNLDYMAKNLDPGEAERLLATAPEGRGEVGALDLLRAKAHLLSNDALRHRLTDPRVRLTPRGSGAAPTDLLPGTRVPIGRYQFIVKGAERGGRKDVRLVLYYDRIPSLLGLKSWLPGSFQKVFRLRRSSQRVVS